MSRELECYLETITSKVTYFKDVYNIRAEIEDHIWCKTELLQLSGISEEDALHQAIVSMGDAQELLKEFAVVHDNSPMQVFRHCMSLLVLASFLLTLHVPQEAKDIVTWSSYFLFAAGLYRLHKCSNWTYYTSLLAFLLLPLELLILIVKPSFGFTTQLSITLKSIQFYGTTLFMFMLGIAIHSILRKHKKTCYLCFIGFGFLLNHYLEFILVRSMDIITLTGIYFLCVVLPLLWAQMDFWMNQYAEPVLPVTKKHCICWTIAGILLFLAALVLKFILKQIHII